MEDRRLLRRGLSLLWVSIRAQPGPYAVSIGGAALFGVMAVGGTIVLGWVTDEVLAPAFDEGGVGGRTIAAGAAAVVAASILRMIGVVLRRYFGMMAQRRMQRHWFAHVTDRYLRVPMRWFESHPAGELLARADNDCERATIALQPLPFSIGVIVIIVVSMARLAMVDMAILAVAMALFPGLAVLNHVYTRRVEKPAALAQARVGEVSAVAHESFEGALVVKALALEAREAERMDRSADALRSARLVVGRLRAGFEPALDALPNLGTVLLLGIGAWRVSNGIITTGELVQAMALFALLAFPFRIVGFLLEELPRAVVAHDRISEVMAAEAAARPASPEALPPGPLRVELDGVRCAFGDEPVLDDLSLELAPGEVVALVGATGSGKSTLCELLANLVDLEGGDVRLGGVSLARADPAEVAAATSLVFQEPFLFADTVRENLAPGTDASDDELWTALQTARAARFVRRLPGGLDEVIGERGVTLSGGQRQRLALARALARRPRLLLLDDATSAVDASVEQQILSTLRSATSATTVVVAHRLSTIALAERVLLLEGGRIAASGRHDELLAVPSYAALVRAYEREEEVA